MLRTAVPPAADLRPVAWSSDGSHSFTLEAAVFALESWPDAVLPRDEEEPWPAVQELEAQLQVLPGVSPGLASPPSPPRPTPH